MWRSGFYAEQMKAEQCIAILTITTPALSVLEQNRREFVSACVIILLFEVRLLQALIFLQYCLPHGNCEYNQSK
jgi:hypothetical protein